MKLVPTVVLLEESYVELLQQWCVEGEVQRIVDEMGDLAERNGWSAEMLLGGMILRDAMKQELNNVC